MSKKMSEHQALVQSILQGKLFTLKSHQRFELIETHISSVIVGRDQVYKLKKPIDLGFLDFSTLEKRHFYCDEEIRLNRRLSPQLYIDVVAIYGSPTDPALQPQGEPIEYLVRMKPFAQNAQLDRLLTENQLTAEIIQHFAEYIADFHQNAAQAGLDTPFGSPDLVWKPVAENFSQIRSMITDTAVIQQLEPIEVWSGQEFTRIRALLAERKSAGYIRECHGDLHLRNLAWMNEQALAFDCIEFDPKLYWIDVISDLSFLYMDLLLNNRADLAWTLLNQYLSYSGDYSALALLRFYTDYRAMVRAKIAAITASQTQQQTQQQALTDLNLHLTLAQQLAEVRKPLVYLMHGPSASGKSSLSQLLAAPLQAIILRSDIERKRLFDIAPRVNASDEMGEGIYTAEATGKTYQRLLELTRQVTRDGYSVIVDATFIKPEQRKLFLDFASSAGYQCVILDLKVSESNLRQRIQQRENDVSDADIQILEQQLKNWQSLSQQELEHSVEIDLNERIDLAAISHLIQHQLMP